MKEIIKFRKRNKTETKNWFFGKIIDKSSTRLTRKKKGSSKFRNERGEVSTDTTGIQRIIRQY